MIATTIEQSKDLLKLGLSPDTADMSYSFNYDNEVYEQTLVAYKDWIIPKYAESKSKRLLPCWSLSALLELMPKNMKGIPEKAAYHFVLKKNVYDAWECNYEHSSFGELYSFPTQKTPIDAVYNMVAWMLENGHIKTENTSPIKNAERVVMTPEQMKAFEESQYKNGWKDIGWGLKRDRNGNIAGGLKRK